MARLREADGLKQRIRSPAGQRMQTRLMFVWSAQPLMVGGQSARFGGSREIGSAIDLPRLVRCAEASRRQRRRRLLPTAEAPDPA